MCPFTVRPEHFSEIIKNRRLVYLSPNAPRAFEHGEFDHDAVYVVGGIVDKAVRRPVTHARARRAGTSILVNFRLVGTCLFHLIVQACVILTLFSYPY